MESLYKILKYEEVHFRYDAEVLLYEPLYRVLDLYQLVKNFTYQMSNGQAGEDINISTDYFDGLISDLKQKNGFVMAAYEFGIMND